MLTPKQLYWQLEGVMLRLFRLDPSGSAPHVVSRAVQAYWRQLDSFDKWDISGEINRSISRKRLNIQAL